MGGLASAPGIRNIGDFINLATPGGILFVGALGDFQEDTATFSWNIANSYLTVNGIKLGRSNQQNADPTGTVAGYLAGGVGGASPASGFNVTAVGAGALQGIGNASTDNTGIGAFALNLANNAAIQNTAVGSKALISVSSGTQNTAVGYLAFSAITTRVRNTGIGVQAAQNVTTGDDNIAIGYQAMQGTAGPNATDNTAIGNLTMQALTGGVGAAHNVAVGNRALNTLTGGANNTVIGQAAGIAITTGANNTAVGQSALNTANLTSCIAIGQNVQVGGNNAIAIGTGAGVITTGANQIEIGNNTHTQTTLHGTVVATAFQGSSALYVSRTSVAWNNGVGAAVGTLNNSPAAGDPTKWLPFDDNGTTRYVPAW